MSHNECEQNPRTMPEHDAAQERILDAAKACYLRLGVAKVTAADIATECGISRATLYRRFPSQNAILLAVLSRDSWEMVAALEARLSGITDPAEHVIEGILNVLDEIVRRPLHAQLFSASGAGWAQSEALGSDEMRGMAAQMIYAMPGMSPSQDPEVERRVEFLSEWILRIIVSYATTPSQSARNRDELRELLKTTLEPAVHELFLALRPSETEAVVKSIS